MNISRCICTAHTFEELLELAEMKKLSLDQLIEHTEATTHCGLCAPYLRRAWRTGQTTFHELLTDEDEPAHR